MGTGRRSERQESHFIILLPQWLTQSAAAAVDEEEEEEDGVVVCFKKHRTYRLSLWIFRCLGRVNGMAAKEKATQFAADKKGG